MIEALHISESGLKANQQWLDIVSNNVANLHTPGFKKASVNFIDRVRVENGATSIAGSQFQPGVGLGTSLSSPRVELTGGNVQASGRELDFAITGKGMLEVILPDGSMGYTRHGSLQINADGYLVTQGGLMLSSQIEIPYDVSKIDIQPNGLIEGFFAGEQNSAPLGEIVLAQMVGSDAYIPLGNSIFKLADKDASVILSPPGEDGAGELVQGFVEMSNVSLVDEMTNIVLAQRAYQLNARLIQTADQMLETINNLRR